MSENTDTKLDPAAEQAQAAEPKLAKQETELVMHPLHAEGPTHTEEGKVDESSATTTTNNTNTTSTTTLGAAATTASAVTGKVVDLAATTKDNVFAMFGGGSREKKKAEPEPDPEDEPSGSSKAKAKDKESGEV